MSGPRPKRLDVVGSGELRFLFQARFDRYRQQCGSDEEALALYEWNTRLSAYYLELLAWVEVVLRNVVHDELTELRAARGLDPRWDDTSTTWFSPWFQPGARDAIRRARNFASPGQGQLAPIGKVVAELTFGFWYRLFAPHYEGSLWTPALRRSFPAGLARSDVYDELRCLRDLRNRVAHHEPVFNGPHERYLTAVERVLGWLAPTLARRVTAVSAVKVLLSREDREVPWP